MDYPTAIEHIGMAIAGHIPAMVMGYIVVGIARAIFFRFNLNQR